MNTESVNKATQNISSASTEEMLTMINNEDKTVATAVEKAIPQISKLVDKAYEVLSGGGRVFYCGAGTSGRLAVADAAELPPTYGLDPQKIVAIIAGGIGAMVNASEGCEDSRERALATFEEYGIKKGDMVIGISASGQAPFVITIMEEARKLGCPVGCITNNQDTLMEKCADITVAALTGAEAIKGSTRMKAGSAQKMILNMFSTAVCIKLGFVYKNYMVNMVTSNRKLRKRAVTMVCEISGISENEAQDLLKKNNWSVYETLKELEK
ncbi:MAG: N-acetylmuramic acid 6-phosphate etherase [Ruminococcaceae bacterium]|nr:N-acetylmuramic acid 6-phosphate etherase [Oscillospiraceae bacterium]